MDGILEKELSLYRKAINQIDDYFEYINESKRDREFVHKILDKLFNDVIELHTKDLEDSL